MTNKMISETGKTSVGAAVPHPNIIEMHMLDLYKFFPTMTCSSCAMRVIYYPFTKVTILQQQQKGIPLKCLLRFDKLYQEYFAILSLAIHIHLLHIFYRFKSHYNVKWKRWNHSIIKVISVNSHSEGLQIFTGHLVLKFQ